MIETQFTEYWNILNLFEDYISTGNRREHPGPPVMELFQIRNDISECTGCPLSGQRRNTVPGEGAVNPQVIVVGAAPDGDEDSSGKPFSGSSGQYLEKWFDAIGLSVAADLFITNIVKCRPLDNRDPESAEISVCLRYLERQIEVLKPDVIITLGEIPARVLTGSDEDFDQIRGKVYSYKKIPLISTYHPAYVLGNPEYRSAVWADLKKLKDKLKSDG